MSFYLDAGQSDWTFESCPRGDSWSLDWDGIVARLGCIEAMRGCRQDPRWHAEGDVFKHTRMVCEALVSLSEWRALPPTERSIVFAATLFHDVGKPACTRTQEDGAITSKGHARHGANMIRSMLYCANDAPMVVREAICSIVRHHGLPLNFLEKESPQRSVIAASLVARCEWLAMVAKADVLGRKCADQRELLDRIELFSAFCQENNCLALPRPFVSDHSRFVYLQKPKGNLEYDAYDDTDFEFILMSGLPGSGKDRWINDNVAGLPVVSLDALRLELSVDPADDQSAVVACAKEKARAFARSKKSFVWNATNVTRQMRDQLVRLAAGYNARVRIVYLEAPYQEILRRNRSRGNAVPVGVIDRLIHRLEVPDLTEAHVISVNSVC
jgi:putative nucleotidyltransferase with HDIG domain